MHYKAPDNSLHFIDPAYSYLLPIGSVQISDSDADAIRAAAPPPPPPAVVDMAQARLALLQAGLLAAVQVAINSMPGLAGDAARIEWEFRPTVRRDSPLVTALASALSLDSAALDQLFIAASAL